MAGEEFGVVLADAADAEGEDEAGEGDGLPARDGVGEVLGGELAPAFAFGDFRLVVGEAENVRRRI